MLSQVISHYRIIGKLGQGGMGEVYLADDSVLGRKVAIKLLAPGSIGDDQARRRLLREAQAAATLDHPNICAIYEIDNQEGVSFIVMQYVDGETLAARLRARPLGLKESLAFIGQVASALEEAHSRGIVHRDIKPQNIIITPRGSVKVLDFGLAKIVSFDETAPAGETQSLLTDAGLIVGTAPYMSPEQAKSAGIDGRSDLFSLGSVLYECVTGAQAFTGTSAIEICSNVIRDDPPAPSRLNPRVPVELDRLILKLLAKNPNDRYQSATELVADLRSVAEVLACDEQTPTDPVRRDSGASRVSAFLRASSIIARRPRIYIPALAVLLVLPLFLFVPGSRWWPSAYQPPPEAKRWYDLGVGHIREGAYYQSTKALEQAISVDDKFAVAHAHLAEAWTELDYTEKAQNEMVRATALVPDPSRLPKADSLYLQAVNLTMAGDFAGAVERFRAIVKESDRNEKARALLDLGRAYERNEDFKNALESYTEAASQDPLYPAAFLRLGIVYGRNNELANAGEQFNRAEKLYEDMGNVEGVAEVLYRRGTLLNNAKNQSSARALLEKSLEMSRATNNRSQRIRTLLQLSSVSCTEGKIADAEREANEALTLARGEEIESLANDGLVELANAFFLRGEYDEAEKYFKQALDSARKYKGRRHEARALLSLGSLAVQQGESDKGIGYVTPALEFYQSRGYRKETSQALTLLGRANRQKGNYDAAITAFEQQLRLAQETGDQAQATSSETGIGTVLSYQERYSEGLSHFDESLKIDQSLGAKLNVGYDLMNRGDMLCRLGRYDEGLESLSQAASIADQPGNSAKQLQAWIHLNYARAALSQRDLTKAQAESKQAIELAATQYKDIAAHAKYTLGLALALSGTRVAGIASCKEAVTLADSINNDRVKHMALLALAEAMLGAGKAGEALEAARSAGEGFAGRGQRDSAWRAFALAAAASEQLHDKANARSYAEQASSLLSALTDRWGAENHARYLARPDVQEYSARLNRVLAVK
jgi:serine/threonine protein kinase/TolA-binding protein